MKIWGRTKRDNRTLQSKTVTIQVKSANEVEDWSEPFSRLCHDMNLSRPVILKKHIRELESFNHTVFLPSDFLEPVEFDKLEIELF